MDLAAIAYEMGWTERQMMTENSTLFLDWIVYHINERNKSKSA